MGTDAALRKGPVLETSPIIADLEAMAQVADQGIVSKSIVENEHHKIIHFTLAPGQELSEHTASVPAVIHVLRGEGKVVLAGWSTRPAATSSTTCRPTSSTRCRPRGSSCSC